MLIRIFSLSLVFLNFLSCFAFLDTKGFTTKSGKGFTSALATMLGAVSSTSSGLENSVDSTPAGSGEVSTSGASLRSTDGNLTIDFPEGAVTENIEFTISKYTQEDSVYPGAYVPTSSGYILSPSYHFKKPVTVTMALDTTKIQALNLIKGNSLGFSYSQTSAEANAGKFPSWSMHNTTVSGDKVVFTTDTFSIFGLGTPPAGNRPPVNLGAFYHFKPGCSYLPYMLRTQVFDPDGDPIEVYLITGPKNGGSMAIRMTREGSTNWYNALIPYEAMKQVGINMQISVRDSYGNNSLIPGSNVFTYPESSGISTFINDYDTDVDNDGILCAWERDHGRSDTTPSDVVADNDSDGIPNTDDHTPNGESNPQIDSLAIFPSEVTMDLGENALFGVMASYLGNPRFVNASISANGIGLNGNNVGTMTRNIFTPSVPGAAAVTASVNGLNAVATAIVRDSLGPNDILDLSAFSISQNKIRLEWSAPGDDGISGKATGYLIFRSTSPITNHATCAGAQITHNLVPKTAGVREALDVAGLVPNTNYYFCVIAMDDSGNFNRWNGGSVLARTWTSPDLSAPNDINNLVAVPLGIDRIQLNWTAVGDDANVGMASNYEIHRSTSPITHLNSCISSVEVPNAISPAAVGTNLSLIVSNLSDNTQYYFCALAVDDVGNYSNWTSNVSATTLRANLPPTAVMNIYQLDWGKGDAIQLRALVSDADGIACNANVGNYQYEWSVVSKPTNSNLTNSSITNQTSLAASVTPDKIGKYTFQIKFTDDAGSCGGGAKNAIATIVLSVVPKFAWVKSITTGMYGSYFSSVATDAAGNIYAAGIQRGIDNYSYGPGVSATSTSNDINAVLVKYDPSGNALWARAISNGTEYSNYSGVAVDANGNVYVAGGQGGRGTFHYGSGVFLTGVTIGWNPTLVKFDSNGNALWAKGLVSSNGSDSAFQTIKIDNQGNVYVAGLEGAGYFDYGNGSSVTASAGQNLVIVKYDSNGNAIWARTSSSSISTGAKGLAIDANGDVIVIGRQYGLGSAQYGNVSLTSASRGENPTLLKYNSFGNALWGSTIFSASNNGSGAGSAFNAISVDISGYIYVAGYQLPNDSINYGGSGVVINTGTNMLGFVLSYGSNGIARWSKIPTINGTSTGHELYGIQSDINGNIYVSGYQGGSATYDYGNGVNFTLATNIGYPIILKLSSTGFPQWIKSIHSGDGGGFRGITLDQNNSIILAGSKGRNVFYENNLQVISLTGSDSVITKISQD
ncbi:MAG: fibronectin type III [Leptospira sp.]|nr:fibronectin type III [Leptospira sp.]